MIAEMVSFRRGLLRPTLLVALCCVALLAAVTVTSASDEPRDPTEITRELNVARQALKEDVEKLARFAEVYTVIDNVGALVEGREPHFDPAHFDRDDPLGTSLRLARLPSPVTSSTMQYLRVRNDVDRLLDGPLGWLLDGLGLERGVSGSELILYLDEFKGTNLRQLAQSISASQKDVDRLTTEFEQAYLAAPSPLLDEPTDPAPSLSSIEDGIRHIEDGIRHFERGEYSEAWVLFDEAVNQGVEPGMAHYGRGSVHAVWEEHHTALADYEAALAHMPNDVRVHFSRGVVYSWLRRDDSAIADWKVACGFLHEESCKWLRVEAGLEEQSGLKLYTGDHLTQAEQHFRAAIEIDPLYPDPYFNLGVALKKGGRLEESATALQAYLAMLERRPFAQGFRTVEVLYGSDPATFDGIDLQAETYDPDQAASAYDWIGAIRYQQGRYAEAVGLYTQSINVGTAASGSVLAHRLWYRGNAHVGNGDKRAALADFRVACSLDHAEACAYKDTFADNLGEPR